MSAGVAFGGIALASSRHGRTAIGEQGDIIQELVEFKNGEDTIKGYLAHPRKAETYRSVLVLHGNLGVSDDIRHTAARLAGAGFAGLAVSSTSRENDEMAKLPREFVMSNRFIERYISDAQAGIEFLKKRSLFGGGRFGVIGYCGGGYTATRLAQADSRVKAVVAFYAAPVSPPERSSQADPRPHMLKYIEQVKIPIQFHYGTRDNLIPNPDVEKLREKLTTKNRKPEIYIYDEAQHGFANMTGETYRADYAALAEKRWRTFLQKHL
ncbi:MAG: dienelactone hydrolase family protein [Acidobacteria bacterium]|nr:dienelactone hydrolase family protein [Acidobacteriota bacterium]